MTTKCPSAERIKSLIYEAFEELPSPESAKLGHISARLTKQMPARHRASHHWLFWLLLGSSMTAAAWWAGTSFKVTSLTPSTVTEERAVTEPEHTQHQPITPATDQAGKQATPAAGTNTNNSVIYQRELY